MLIDLGEQWIGLNNFSSPSDFIVRNEKTIIKSDGNIAF
jgi:hypothetical protein